MTPARRVLFVCEGNRARSQLAEAMLRHHGAGRFEVYSAGIRPGDEVIENKRQPMLTGEDGRAVLEIICAAYLSARTGERQSLPIADLRRTPVDFWLAE